jgi:hypothetical protein
VAISTRSELITSLGSWLNRDDLTSVIPDFITLAEVMMEQGATNSPGLRVRELVNRSQATLDDEYEDVPDDFLEMTRLSIQVSGGWYTLDYLTPTQLIDQYGAAAPGTPQAYTVEGTKLHFLPAPSSSFTMEMVYYTTIPRLTAASPTNAILTAYPNLYLYGSLIQASPFLGDDGRVSVWADLYQTMISGITTTEERALFNASPLTVRVDAAAP